MGNYRELQGTPLSALDLRELRATQAVFLPDTCTIVRNVAGRSGQGAPTETPGTIATNVPCRVMFRWWMYGAEEVELAGRESSFQRYIVTLPWNQDVKEQDQINVGTFAYEVERVLEDSPTWRTARRVDVFILSS